MNRVVRVVTRKYSKIANKLITKEVFNEVVGVNTAKAARKIIRKKYGPTVLIGLNRRTNKEPGIYTLIEKELVASNG